MKDPHTPVGAPHESRDWIASELERRQGRWAKEHPLPPFDANPYRPSALARARRLWAARATAEHEAGFVFGALMPLAWEAGASLDVQTLLAGMAQDELRHSAICTRVVLALGGDSVPSLQATALGSRTERSAQEQWLSQIIFGNCMTETINAARLVDASEGAEDPFMKAALRSLLADEVHHARFGFVVLEQWQPWLAEHPEVQRALDQSLAPAFAALERLLSGKGAPREDYAEDDRLLGSPDPATLPEIFYMTVEEAVVPGLARLGFDAARAWRQR